jgi:hypothetical protein
MEKELSELRSELTLPSNFFRRLSATLSHDLPVGIDYKHLTLAAGTDWNILLEGNCLRR